MLTNIGTRKKSPFSGSSVFSVPRTGTAKHYASWQNKWLQGLHQALQNRAKQGKFGSTGDKLTAGRVNDAKLYRHI